MTRKGVSNHMRTLSAPRSWHFNRKENKYIIKTKPGPHSNEEAIPLRLVLRQMIKIGDTAKEIKLILNEKKVKVNGTVVLDPKHPVGLSDTIAVDEAAKYYRIVIDKKGRFKPVEINEKEAALKIVKITDKTALPKGKIQINLSDGTNILVKKGEYKTRDSLLLKLPEKEVVKVLKHAKGNIVLITKGKHAGRLATIQEIKDDGKLVLKEENNVIETPENYVLVVGEKKPELVITYE